MGLKAKYGDSESQWWMEGVPEKIRLEARSIWEQDKGKRGGTECYLNLIHYRAIATKNWDAFQDLLGYGKGNKDARTAWIAHVNELRNQVKHAGSMQSVSTEQVAELREYDEWLSSGDGVDDALSPSD